MLDRRLTRTLTIDRMKIRHVGDVMGIERDAYPRPWTAQVFHDELHEARSGRRHYVVARRGRTVVGYGGLMFVAGEAHVTNIAVHPAERRHHIGTRIMASLADEAIERGCTAWTLEVRATSTRRPGAVPHVRVRPGRRAQGLLREREDAIVMWCHDIQSDEYRQRLARLLVRAAERP